MILVVVMQNIKIKLGDVSMIFFFKDSALKIYTFFSKNKSNLIKKNLNISNV